MIIKNNYLAESYSFRIARMIKTRMHCVTRGQHAVHGIKQQKWLLSGWVLKEISLTGRAIMSTRDILLLPNFGFCIAILLLSSLTSSTSLLWNGCCPWTPSQRLHHYSAVAKEFSWLKWNWLPRLHIDLQWHLKAGVESIHWRIKIDWKDQYGNEKVTPKISQVCNNLKCLRCGIYPWSKTVRSCQECFCWRNLFF